MRGNPPLLISFSGIDGAGKSTQIASLVACLCESGMRVVRLAYWDDAAVLKRFREDTMARVFKGEKGIGNPEKPVRRNDKNVRRWYLTLGRCALFLLDAVHLREVVASARRKQPDVIVFDRYSYDPLATLPLSNKFVGAYVRFLLKVVPRPDIAYLLEAEPESAYRRKPEYPVDFLHRYQKAYLSLGIFCDEMRVIGPGRPDEIRQKVWEEVAKYFRNLEGAHLVACPVSRGETQSL